MEHYFAGTGRGVGGAFQFGEHLLGGALKVDADAHAGGQLDLHFFERRGPH